jgi:hypothetical protein
VKDTKNNLLWNPSSAKLQNVEEDEAGRLRNFRKRFGRGFDAEAVEREEGNDKVGSWSFQDMSDDGANTGGYRHQVKLHRRRV